MEILAGFYIIVGFAIIFFKSEFIKKHIFTPIEKGNKNLRNTIEKMKLPVYPSPDRLILQKVPVRANYKY
jgi:hypothetical protein